jgi:hypothetical protein
LAAPLLAHDGEAEGPAEDVPDRVFDGDVRRRDEVPTTFGPDVAGSGPTESKPKTGLDGAHGSLGLPSEVALQV